MSPQAEKRKGRLNNSAHKIVRKRGEMDQMEETDKEKERYKVKLRNSNQEMATSCLYHFGAFAPSQTLATTALTDATVSAALRLGNADLRPDEIRAHKENSQEGSGFLPSS